jgi:hypothetical protein
VVGRQAQRGAWAAGRRQAGRVGLLDGIGGGRGGRGRWWRRALLRLRVEGEGKEKEKERVARSVNVTSLPSAHDLALGKDFFKIKKYTFPSALDPALGKDVFAECPLTSTRQSI